MNELDVFEQMSGISQTPQMSLFPNSRSKLNKINEHKAWLRSVRHERPSTNKAFRIGVYIRYFNQTKYDDYLSYHKAQFIKAIGMCPKWQLVEFYIDEGATAPNMESAPEWSRLLMDCMDGKIDLIITQKVSNISKKTYEASLCARLLATQTPPIGIYFISEDLFTLASYYQDDIRDVCFLPDSDRLALEEDLREDRDD